MPLFLTRRSYYQAAKRAGEKADMETNIIHYDKSVLKYYQHYCTCMRGQVWGLFWGRVCLFCGYCRGVRDEEGMGKGKEGLQGGRSSAVTNTCFYSSLASSLFFSSICLSSLIFVSVLHLAIVLFIFYSFFSLFRLLVLTLFALGSFVLVTNFWKAVDFISFSILKQILTLYFSCPLLWGKRISWGIVPEAGGEETDLLITLDFPLVIHSYSFQSRFSQCRFFSFPTSSLRLSSPVPVSPPYRPLLRQVM